MLPATCYLLYIPVTCYLLPTNLYICISYCIYYFRYIPCTWFYYSRHNAQQYCYNINCFIL